jgi:hypothetical protein
MRQVVINLPTFAFIVSTRAVLGAGIGLLLSERLPIRRRRAIGAALVAVGAATTVPIVRSLIANSRRRSRVALAVDRDTALIGVARFPRKGDDEL